MFLEEMRLTTTNYNPMNISEFGAGSRSLSGSSARVIPPLLQNLLFSNDHITIIEYFLWPSKYNLRRLCAKILTIINKYQNQSTDNQ